MSMRRYDVYGFREAGLDEAARWVHEALGIALARRDSSYRGVYYAAGHAPEYLLQENGPEARWHSRFPEFGVTLMVSNVPAMDEVRERLTAGRADPVLLHTIVLPDEPDDEDEEDDE